MTYSSYRLSNSSEAPFVKSMYPPRPFPTGVTAAAVATADGMTVLILFWAEENV